jgi:hypothetical protein
MVYDTPSSLTTHVNPSLATNSATSDHHILYIRLEIFQFTFFTMNWRSANGRIETSHNIINLENNQSFTSNCAKLSSSLIYCKILNMRPISDKHLLNSRLKKLVFPVYVSCRLQGPTLLRLPD